MTENGREVELQCGAGWLVKECWCKRRNGLTPTLRLEVADEDNAASGQLIEAALEQASAQAQAFPRQAQRIFFGGAHLVAARCKLE